MAIEEDEVVGEAAIDALDHAVQQLDGGALAALFDGIQRSHFYTVRVRRRSPPMVTNDSSHARSFDF